MSASLCAECGVILRPGDGAIGAFGVRFCSEDCVDSYEDANGDDPKYLGFPEADE